MSQTITKIKSRISSVTGAYKVTSAMKLVSTVKLKSWRSKMLASRAYSEKIEKTIHDVFANLSNDDTVYLKGNGSSKRLYIVVSSTLGLCGAYNFNIFKVADASIKEDDDVIILGKKGAAHFSEGKFNKIDISEGYSSIKDLGKIKTLSIFIISQFESGKYGEIHFVYTHYKNPIAFISKDVKVLPLSVNTDSNYVGYGPLLEPDPQLLLKMLIPFYINNVVYSKLLESEVCEQASRSNAMENATKNAEDLLATLKIEFNKARQGAITQEITEIAAAAEAM